VDNPTRQTFVVEMVGVDQLRNAVTLNSVMVNVARAVGPAIAGVLIASVGSGWCFLINALSFGFVLLSLRAIHTDELVLTPRAQRLRGQIREGFRYVGRTPLLRDALLMMALIGCLTYEFQTTLPLMAGNTFHGDSRTYGFLTACMGVGAVAGGLVAAGRRGHGPSRLVATAGVFGVAVLAAAVAPSLGVEAVILLVVGACSVTFLSLGNATLQLGSAPAMRGRVMSLWSVAFLGSTPIGGPLVGLVGGSLGARYALGVGGLAALIAAGYGRVALRRRSGQEGAEREMAASKAEPGRGPRQEVDSGQAGGLDEGPVPALRGAE
jgi:MFS family permease